MKFQEVVPFTRTESGNWSSSMLPTAQDLSRINKQLGFARWGIRVRHSSASVLLRGWIALPLQARDAPHRSRRDSQRSPLCDARLSSHPPAPLDHYTSFGLLSRSGPLSGAPTTKEFEQGRREQHRK